MDKQVVVCVCICIYLYTYICIHTHTHTDVEYYAAIKNEEILPFATTWMDLKGIVLSEISAKKPQQTHRK